MKDLISLVDYYIHNDGIKDINCSYEYKYTLSNIANIINQLDTQCYGRRTTNLGRYGVNFLLYQGQRLPLHTETLELTAVNGH